MSPPRYELLGGKIDAFTRPELMAWMEDRVDAPAGGLLLNHNLHSLALLGQDSEMRSLYEQADRIQIDSMPLVAWGRLLGLPLAREHRLTYLDWRDDFWALAAARGWRVFHLGCAPGVGEAARERLTARHPRLMLETRHGFFDVDGLENDEVLRAIAQFRPDILLLGMGMPRQEGWLLRNRSSLDPVVAVTVGGALAYDAEAVPTPPRWTGRLGVEWLWRFTTEPGRLFHRYFIEPRLLAGPALKDVLRRRVYRSGIGTAGNCSA